MDEQTTWTGKLSLTALAGRLCPNLQRRYGHATMIGARGKPLPPGSGARLAKCAAKFAVKETARLVTKEGRAIASCPAGAEEFTGEQGAIPPEANVTIDADAKVMIWYGDRPARISPERFAEIENIAQQKAQAEAERQARDFYKRIADRAEQRICGKILQAIANDEHFCFTGRRGDLLEDIIPAHLATRLEVDLAKRTIRLPPDGVGDPGMVWRDVFISCTPDESGRLDVAKSPRRGRPNTTKARAREYLDQKYPKGTAAAIRSLVDELKAAKIFASPTTVERALGAAAIATDRPKLVR